LEITAIGETAIVNPPGLAYPSKPPIFGFFFRKTAQIHTAETERKQQKNKINCKKIPIKIRDRLTFSV
jgi:hypothetical protein